jgi:L-ornithine Nalpha-acyltransferase
MAGDDHGLEVRLARDALDLRAAQRLRYDVFVTELGGDGPLVDHAARLEADEFDTLFDHLVLVDPARPAGEHVVGVYRLLPGDRLGPDGRFYSEGEFDLGPLKSSGRRLVELGRSCVAADHRGGSALYLMWNGLAAYVLERGIEVMFGAASFHGTDVEALAEPLSWLYHHHLAPPGLRVAARPAHRREMNLIPREAVDRAAAQAMMPALIKAYLRLGGCVGDGAWVDHAFNTTDVCLVMDTGAMSARHRDFYIRKKGQG